MALVVLGVLSILFIVLRMSGDPVLMLVPPEASAEEIERLRQSLGFADPLWKQYIRFLGQLARLDFGQSLVIKEPALRVVLGRAPATIQLALAAFAIAIPVGFASGVYAAVRRGQPMSYVAGWAAVLGQSVPTFWLGIVLILVFSVQFRLLPSFGYGSPAHLVLPAVTLSGFLTAKLSRLVRSQMLEALSQEYVTVARAKGLSMFRVLMRHAIPNALIPVVSLIGLDLANLLGGAVITETVFSWPGIGRQLVEAVLQRDYPVVQTSVMTITLIVVIVMLLTDLFYTILDPRIRFQ
jgi:peptide/nickel transport system permease protein